jgi:uridine kinase
MDSGEIAREIRARTKTFPYIIAIDGTIGSGKSYIGKELEKALSPDALLITMDLFVRVPRAEWDRKIEAGNIRLRDWYDIGKARDILLAIKFDRGLDCRDLYDVETGAMRGCITIDPGSYRYFILEGLFSLDDELGGLVDLGIFVDTPVDVALVRAESRDESRRHLDPHGWIEKKEIYYDGYLPYIDGHRKKAGIVIGD